MKTNWHTFVALMCGFLTSPNLLAAQKQSAVSSVYLQGSIGRSSWTAGEFSSDISLEPVRATSIGLGLESRPLLRNVRIATEISIANRGVETRESGQMAVGLSVSFLDLSLLARFRGIDIGAFVVRPQIGTVISLVGSNSLYDPKTSREFEVEADLQEAEVSGTAGIRVHHSSFSRIAFDVRYNAGITAITDDGGNNRSRSWLVSFSYAFFSRK